MKNTGQTGRKDGPLRDALFRYPRGISIDKEDNLFMFDDTYIRMINLHTQQVNTIAGNGVHGTRYQTDEDINLFRYSFTSFPFFIEMELDWMLHFNILLSLSLIQRDSSMLLSKILSEE